MKTASDVIKIDPDPLTAYQQGDAAGQALVYVQQVDAGAKPVASLQVKADFAERVRETARQHGCQTMEAIRDGGWVDFWIYKYPFVRLLINEIEKRGAPKSAFDTWVNGKLFGYSDCEIARALEEEGYIDSALT